MDLDAVPTMRFVWLLLTGMMLVSRVMFQWAGPARMRQFLDTWKIGHVRQGWGGVSLALAALVIGLGIADRDSLDWRDILLTLVLIAVLVADGSVNVLPSGFTTFKDRMQQGWVRRHAGSERADDRHLFGVVNLALAIAAASMALVVILYRPIDADLVVGGFLTAVVLAPSMVALTAGLRP